MGEFLSAATAFSAALFGPAVVVVLVYWLFVLVDALGVDALDGGGDVGPGVSAATSGSGSTGALAAFGLGGVPVAVALSLLFAIAWFVSLVAVELSASPLVRVPALPVALVVACEAQTLTGGAEANVLKLAELCDRMTPEQRARVRRDHRTGRAPAGAPRPGRSWAYRVVRAGRRCQVTGALWLPWGPSAGRGRPARASRPSRPAGGTCLSSPNQRPFAG